MRGDRPWHQRLSPQAADLVVATGLFAWGLPEVPWWWRPDGGGPTLRVLGVLALVLLGSVPFLVRRRFPGVVLACCVAVLGVEWAVGLDVTAAWAGAMAAMYAVGVYGDRVARSAAVVLGALAVLTGAALTLANPETSATGRAPWYLAGAAGRFAGLPFVLFGLFLVIGDAVRSRKLAFAAAIERSAELERLRIARELHDVIAHQLAVITLQAGGVRLATRDEPAAAALRSVETTARAAMVELSHLLGAIRHDTPGVRPRAPAPGLDSIGELVDAAARAGMAVQLVVEGEPRPLPAGVELSAFRIVQEAITNVAKHAAGARARILLRFGRDGVDVEVSDTGAATGAVDPAARRLPGGQRVPAGTGITGMTERTAALGGELRAGPRPGGGFTVAARLPTGEPAP